LATFYYLSSFFFYLLNFILFFSNDTSTTKIYTLSLHDALPIYSSPSIVAIRQSTKVSREFDSRPGPGSRDFSNGESLRELFSGRSEEHTSELQSLAYLVCRLLLEKKKKKNIKSHHSSTHTSILI